MPLKLKPGGMPTLLVTREKISTKHLCYVARANKKISYPYGKSSIIYIGKTRDGLARVASSAAWKANSLLGQHGIKTVAYFVVEVQRRQRVQAWSMLERVLLIRFREKYGRLPLGNTQLKNVSRGPEFDLFSPVAIDKVLDGYEDVVEFDYIP